MRGRGASGLGAPQVTEVLLPLPKHQAPPTRSWDPLPQAPSGWTGTSSTTYGHAPLCITMHRHASPRVQPCCIQGALPTGVGETAAVGAGRVGSRRGACKKRRNLYFSFGSA